MQGRQKPGSATVKLWEETRQQIARCGQLHQQNARLKENLRDVLTRNQISRRALRLNILRPRAKARFIRFPGNEFTLQELEHVNPAFDPGCVRMELAAAIRSGRVEFIQIEEKSYGGVKHIAYRSKRNGPKPEAMKLRSFYLGKK